MVWRWRNERHAGHRIAKPRNELIDLAARQLTTLTRLRPLGHLNLQHLGVDQIMRRHAKSAGGDLLDFGYAVGAKPAGILSALTTIGSGANLIHTHGERLMRFR